MPCSRMSSQPSDRGRDLQRWQDHPRQAWQPNNRRTEIDGLHHGPGLIPRPESLDDLRFSGIAA